MEFTNVLLEISESIATITINRPAVLNALNSETVRELGAAVGKAGSDPAVLGIIITGSGDKSFVAGADISELAEKNTLTGRKFALDGQGVYNLIEQTPKPVIAAVNGFALGGGCELAMSCHMRVAAAHAKFGQPEVGLGVIPGYVGTQRLPRLIGKGRALELLLGGGIINAAEAYRIGLANCVVDASKVDEEGEKILDPKGRPVFDKELFIQQVRGMLKGFITKGPVALEYVIEAVNRGLDIPLDEALRIEADLFGNIFATDDSKEGLQAFLEKRVAEFKGQ